MHLLDQIDHRLRDPKFSLDRNVFERASLSMLSDIYPNLVPITGGSDDGRDGEIDDAAGRIGVQVTSARDLRGVLANLRSGCRQMDKKGVPISRLILANLADLNAAKRTQVIEAAADEGFTVAQIYPRAWYADSLRRNATWRLELLQLPGGPYSLTRPPFELLSVAAHDTVGRADELAAITGAAGDLLVSGAPGVGKTHLVAQTARALFIEKTTDLTRLSDHILETQPSVLVLDDAGARPAILTELQTIRRSHDLQYRIIAVCWPHEGSALRDLLEPVERVEIGSMTKGELGAILRARGIERDAVLHRILEHAHGRPAWAVRMGELLKDESVWDDVMRGKSVRAQVATFLQTARVPPHADTILATIAILGGISDDEFRKAADVLGISVLDLHRVIRAVAESGLLDAQQTTDWQGQRTVTYTVQPELLAVGLTADAFFSADPPPLPLRDLRAALPTHDFQILMNTVRAALVGASHASRPSASTIAAVIGSRWNPDIEKLVARFALLGTAEARFAIDWVTERLGQALIEKSDLCTDDLELHRYHRTVEKRAHLLADIAARSHDQLGRPEALSHLARGAVIMTERNESTDFYFDRYFALARQANLGESVPVRDLVRLTEAIAVLRADSPEEFRCFIGIAARAMSPTWEANYSSPDSPMSFNLRSYLLPVSAFESVTAPILDRLESQAHDIGPQEFAQLIKPLETWIDISRDYPLPHGLRVTAEQAAVAETVAKKMAALLGASDLKLGTRARLNELTAPLRMHWAEPDALFAALTQDFEPEEDDNDATAEQTNIDTAASRYMAQYEAVERSKEHAAAEVTKPYLTQDPNVLCAKIAELRPQFASVKGGGRPYLVFTYIAQTGADPIPWLSAAFDHGVAGYSYALIRTALQADTIPDDLLTKLLASADTRATLLRLSLEVGTGATLTRAIASLTQNDFIHRFHDAFVRITPEALALLNKHPDQQIAALGITCWAHWYHYRQETSDAVTRTEAQLAAIPEWTRTMTHLEVPNVLDEHALESGLISLARTSPADFIDMFVNHTKHDQLILDDFNEWAPAAATLGHASKTSAWVRVTNAMVRPRAFWVLAGADIEWIRTQLDNGTVSELNDLLMPPTLGGAERPTDEEFVAIFANRAAPEAILNALPDTYLGADEAQAEHRLEQSTTLALSQNPDVAAIGEFGVKAYSQRLREAQRAARERQLRGDDW